MLTTPNESLYCCQQQNTCYINSALQQIKNTRKQYKQGGKNLDFFFPISLKLLCKGTVAYVSVLFQPNFSD